MSVAPSDAGFDGAKGIRVPIPQSPDYRVILLRGSKPPSNYPNRDFREQLVWLTPAGEPPRLLWCNANDEWFELTFNPCTMP